MEKRVNFGDKVNFTLKFSLSLFFGVCLHCIVFGQTENFTLSDIMSYPFPNELCASANGSKIAWAFNEDGLRNIYVAEGPEFQAIKITPYDRDDGQEISSLSISSDGKWLVYIRGGDFGSNWDDALPVNPSFDPTPPKLQIWSILFDGGDPIALAEGESPVISPSGNELAFVKSNQIWTVPFDGSSKPRKLFHARGSNQSPVWSPDGMHIAFTSSRGDHSFIGIYTDSISPIHWVNPSFYRDFSPKWSPDGGSVVFIRQEARGGAPEPILTPSHNAWEIMVHHIESEKNQKIWEAPKTLRGSVPTTHGRTNLHWANGHIVFLSYHDGWPHLYSVPDGGGKEQLLTPGNYMAEYISLSKDGKWLVFAANAGEDPLDIDRRHIVRVAVDGSVFEVLTPGDGLEWTPYITGDGKYLAYLSATAQRCPLPVVLNLESRDSKILAEELIPDRYPEEKLITPQQVVFQAPDGVEIHGTLFRPLEGELRKPAIVYIHGGPPRQMLLGWHYSSYYSNAYALNQYLASRGFVVLSVNYRLGIGYGYEFHRPPDGGTYGASEYQDIKAAGEWLAAQSFVDSERIGVYGGSYGGYLTAMALGRDSDLFAAGVDIHGVHDRTVNRIANYLYPNQFEKAPDAEYAARVAWQSSPVADVGTWRSPVLIIHADDDRNVQFSQSTDLVQRLKAQGVDMETMVIVDDTHHFMKHSNQLSVNEAVAVFFSRKLK